MSEFYYKTNEGVIQGPYSEQKMQQWYREGYFHSSLPIRVGSGRDSRDWITMGDLIISNGAPMPFFCRRSVVDTKSLIDEKDSLILSLEHKTVEFESKIRQLTEINKENMAIISKETELEDKFLKLKTKFEALEVSRDQKEDEVRKMSGELLKEQESFKDRLKDLTEENTKLIDKNDAVKKSLDQKEDELRKRCLEWTKDRESYQNQLKQFTEKNKTLINKKDALINANNVKLKELETKIGELEASNKYLVGKRLELTEKELNMRSATKTVIGHSQDMVNEKTKLVEILQSKLDITRMELHIEKKRKIAKQAEPTKSNASKDARPENPKYEDAISRGVNADGSTNAVLITHDVLTHIHMLALWSSNLIYKYEFRESTKRILMYVSNFLHEFCWEFDEKSISEKENNLKSLCEVTTAGDIHAIENLLDYIED